MGERKGTKGLELWCRRITEGYPGVQIDNMTTSWRDGLAFCAIIHHFRSDLIDFNKLKKNDVYHNNELAFSIAERHLGIPALLEPEDMVEYSVPDRLSILTYLSQFYQVFAVQGSAQSRVASKRPQPPAEPSIVSSDSSSPSKIPHIGKVRREACAQCALPVFITERLNVGKLLYHRTCFRCARCKSQLTLDNFYETESGQYCCEVCPDEEKPSTIKPQDVLQKPMSDEEKSANLLNREEETDEYSTTFETALEIPEDTTNSQSSTECAFTIARSRFMNSQIIEETSNSNDKTEDEQIESALQQEECDNSFPTVESNLDSSVNSSVNINTSCNSNEIVNDLLKESQSVVTKEVPSTSFSNSDSQQEPPSSKTIENNDIINTQSNTQQEEKYKIIEEKLHVQQDDERSATIEIQITNEVLVEEEPPKIEIKEEEYPEDLNPFDGEEDSLPKTPVPTPRHKTPISSPQSTLEKPIAVSRKKKIIPAPKINLNPFLSSDEDDEDFSDLGSLKPSEPSICSSSSINDTPESRSPNNTTLRKKKPAPKPPVKDDSTLQPIQTENSPKTTPHSKKSRKAPLPPTVNSTPKVASSGDFMIGLSPITYENSEDYNKLVKDETNRNRQSLSEDLSYNSKANKSTYGKWKKRKGQAPSRPPPPQRRIIGTLLIEDIRSELGIIEIQLQGLEKQGVRLEQIIRDKCEGNNKAQCEDALPPEAEDLILQFFDVINERNELFRKQTELMHLRKQQRLEEEHAEVEYQIRCLMMQPEANKTDTDKACEEQLINRLLEIVESRNNIIDCLEMDRIREAEEDDSINNHLNMFTKKKDDCTTEPNTKPSKEKKKHKKEKRSIFKTTPQIDVDKDIDEHESVSTAQTTHKKKKKKGFFKV